LENLLSYRGLAGTGRLETLIVRIGFAESGWPRKPVAEELSFEARRRFYEGTAV